jgi:hypothetical protein
MSYDEPVAVRLLIEKVRVPSRNGGSYEEIHYTLDLLTEVVDHAQELGPVAGIIQRQIAARAGEVAAGDAELSDEELLRNIPGLRIMQHGNQDEVWRLSELVAKELDVPQIDLWGSEIELRLSRELDMPLAERLGKGLAIPPEPSQRPDTATLSIDGAATTLSFRPGAGGLVLLFSLGLVPAAFLLFVHKGHDLAWLSTVGMALAGLCVAGILFALFGPRQAQLLIDPEQVVYRSPWGVKRRLPASAVEAVRRSPRELALISDKKTLHCPHEGGEWMRDDVLRAFARTRPKLSEGPYR